MRIVIVEDEIRIREGLSSLLPTLDKEYDVVGCADNGQNGLNVIHELHPDLVITDIRMPVMSGLEMLSILRSEGSTVKAVVLTAYGDFDYAKQAISLSVSEYIVKPVVVSEVSDVLRHIAEQLAANGRSSGIGSLEEILDDIVMHGTTPDKNTIDRLAGYSITGQTTIVLMPVYIGAQYDEKSARVKGLVLDALKENGADRCFACEAPQSGMLVFVIPSPNDAERLYRRFDRELIGRLNSLCGLEMCFGWAESTGVQKLRESFLHISKSLEWNMSAGENRLISDKLIGTVETVPLSYPIDIETSTRKALCAFEHEKTVSQIRLFEQYFKSGAVYYPKEIKECYVRFLWSMINVAKVIDYNTFNSINQQQMLDRMMSAVTFSEMTDSLMQLAEVIIGAAADEDSVSLNVQRVKSMVHEFYNQGVTLDEIADKLQMTPEYLGTLFHHEMGMTFSTYLRNYRIQKAKELLVGTRLKSYEIAEQVGYSDAKYFSKVFKTVTGELPAEYRARHT